MKSLKGLESSLSRIVDAIKIVDGIIGIILFGSVAKEKADQGSDIDLLVLFKDENAMRRNEWEVTRRIPPDIFTQSICVCPSTLKAVNPVFLQSVLEDGIILYMQHPLDLRLRLASTVTYLIVSYSLEGLPQREKQKIDYRLFGKVVGERGYVGLIEKHGGKRLGRGCFFIPKESSESIMSFLNKHNLKYELMEVYVPETQKFLKELETHI